MPAPNEVLVAGLDLNGILRVTATERATGCQANGYRQHDGVISASANGLTQGTPQRACSLLLFRHRQDEFAMKARSAESPGRIDPDLDARSRPPAQIAKAAQVEGKLRTPPN